MSRADDGVDQNPNLTQEVSMKLKYTEGPAAMTVSGIGAVERGETIDVSGDQAKRLVEQGWEKVGAKKKASAKNRGAKKKAASKSVTEPSGTGGTSDPPATPASTDPAAG
jgi:hypothetical protein